MWKNSLYNLNPRTGVWSRDLYAGIAYSDGREVEKRLANIIDQASDRSVLSTELRTHFTDWASVYHLSGARANILRPFTASLAGADVLEIGAGCGAITRFLGEAGANVVALEGSIHRASITRSRTRELSNVEVVADRFDDFVCEGQFDFITLIGVLEYAGMYGQGDDPAQNMLSRARTMLKPGGRLILAIENKLGLKYFAGAPEDHTGEPMYGVEGRYQRGQVRTYGRKELARLLERSGFRAMAFMAPFPDYKLPVSIVTERGFSEPDFDAAAFAWQSVRRDPQLPHIMTFSPELVWPAVFENGFALDMANSFLVVASSSDGTGADGHALAWHYSTERKKEFCKETRFRLNEKNAIELHYVPLAATEAGLTGNDLLKFNIPARAEYHRGRLLSQELLQIVTTDGWKIEQVGLFLAKYRKVLEGLNVIEGYLPGLNGPDVRLPGVYFDLLPQNIIITDDGRAQVIDKEWEATEPVDAGYLFFRVLWNLLGSTSRLGRKGNEAIRDAKGFICSALSGLGWAVEGSTVDGFIQRESRVQAHIGVNEFNARGVLAHYDWTISSGLNAHLALRARDALLAEREEQIRALRMMLEKVNASYSWRITAPLRFLLRIMRHEPLDDDLRWLQNKIGRASGVLLGHVRIRARKFYLCTISVAQRFVKRHSCARCQEQDPPKAVGNMRGVLRVPGRWEHRKNPYGVLILPVIDWDFRFQRPQQLARCFAKKGHSVAYVSLGSGRKLSVTSIEHNINEVRLPRSQKINAYQDTPTKTQAENFAGALASHISDVAPHRPWICIVQLPYWAPVADRLRALVGCPVIYDCMDDHAGFTTNSKNMLAAEDHLLRHADLVIATSALLFDKAGATATRRALIRNAVDYAHFSKVPPTVHQADRNIIVGYYGAIANWFDSALVAEMARLRPSWRLVLIGSTYSAETAPLALQSNISLLGEQPYQHLPALIETWDCCIIPFKRVPLTEATNPVKVYEMLAAGKPVVSVRLPELLPMAEAGHIALADTAFDFVLQVEQQVQKDSAALQDGRRRFASENTWEARHSSLDDAIRNLYPLVSIIVVTYNNLSYNRLCLESLLNDTDYPNYEVIVVDNNSTDGTAEYLKSLSYSNLQVVLNNENLGFSAANNQGLALSRGQYLCLLNNDTVVSGSWLSTLVRHLQANPRLGLVGPVTNAIGNEAKIPVGYRNLMDMPTWAANYCRRNSGYLDNISMLAFFCVAMPRSVYESVGLLDCRFGIGMFEDDDYNRRVREAGYQIKLARDSYVHHWQRASFKLLGEEAYLGTFSENKKKYQSKWAQQLLRRPEADKYEVLVAASKKSARTIIFAPSIGWNIHLFQRPHHLARAFAQHGCTVVFDCGNSRDDVPFLSEVESGLFLFKGNPELLANLNDPVIWTFTYNYEYRDRFPLDIPVVYDWIDDLTVFPYDMNWLAQLHARAIKEAAVVTCVARRLLESATLDRPDALYLPNAVEYSRFDVPPDPNPAQDDLEFCRIVKRGKPIAGYYGALAHWFDYDLLAKTARRCPDWEFVLIGPDHDGSIPKSFKRNQGNITWLGPRHYRALPGYLHLFDVAIIPFKINEITLATSPLKLFEYFAGGKPVVSTPMPECSAFEEVSIAANPEAFASALKEARASARSPDVKRRLARIAEANTWRTRVRVMLDALDGKNGGK